MRITVFAIGSRGDVQPIVALALGLRHAGHEVRVATHTNFEGLVRSQGLGFAAMSGDPDALQRTEAGRRLLASGSNPFRFLGAMKALMDEVGRPFFDDALAATRDAEAVIGGPLSFVAALIAEERGIPVVWTALQPVYPTWDFPDPMSPPDARWGRLYNRATFAARQLLFWTMLAPLLNGWRRRVGLPGPFRPRDWTPPAVPAVYGFSPALFPAGIDWGPNIRPTGYWFLDLETGWTPPPALAAFLAEGPPPVYVGFGSMNDRDPEGTTRLILEAIAQTGLRAVIGTGWAGLGRGELPPGVLAVESVPHEWLFPRMAAVVHHGGAGTTAAGLRAGRPTVCVPFMADQAFWGHRVHQLGAGPRPVPRKRLDAASLADAIRAAATDAGMAARAAELGERIRAEHGVEAAVALIEAALG